MAPTIVAHECDACGAEAWGYTKAELVDEGWKFHWKRGARLFVMCAECEEKFAQRRAAA